MVDSGATHNFIAETKACRLNMNWDKDRRKIKVINSITLPIFGIVK